VLSQENAIAAEAKTVLDSWVRHEQQVRESEQSELVKTIQANVLKQLAEPKFKKDLLSSAVSEVEGQSFFPSFPFSTDEAMEERGETGGSS
jgi:F-type H+-transporting ATPase subunit b